MLTSSPGGWGSSLGGGSQGRGVMACRKQKVWAKDRRRLDGCFWRGGRNGRGWSFALLAASEGTQCFVPTVRKYRDDLPTVRASRLRSLNIITAETTRFLVQLDDVEQTVGIYLLKFQNGGSWSLFICPTCGHRAQALRLLDDEIICRKCCERRRIQHRVWTLSVKQRAERRIPKLRAMLESAECLRLKPHLWGTMEKRARHAAALQRAEFIVARSGHPRKTKTIVDPAAELDFVAPKRPWPRLKSKWSEDG